MGTAADGAARGAAGARFYTRVGLSLYDVGVLGFNNHVVWRCPTRRLLQQYNENVSANHLEAGVGTGWYLDHCRFPVPQPRIGLIDLNPSALAKTRSRLRRFEPESHHADLLEPVPALTDPFDSLAMCYLLHCLPVEPEHKSQVVPNLRALLNPGSPRVAASRSAPATSAVRGSARLAAPLTGTRATAWLPARRCSGVMSGRGYSAAQP